MIIKSTLVLTQTVLESGLENSWCVHWTSSGELLYATSPVLLFLETPELCLIRLVVKNNLARANFGDGIFVGQVRKNWHLPGGTLHIATFRGEITPALKSRPCFIFVKCIVGMISTFGVFHSPRNFRPFVSSLCLPFCHHLLHSGVSAKSWECEKAPVKLQMAPSSSQ